MRDPGGVWDPDRLLSTLMEGQQRQGAKGDTTKSPRWCGYGFGNGKKVTQVVEQEDFDSTARKATQKKLSSNDSSDRRLLASGEARRRRRRRGSFAWVLKT